MVGARVLAVLGSLFAAFGAIFLPMARLPFVGELTYTANGHGDGMFVVGTAVLCLIFSLCNVSSISILGGAGIGALLVHLYSRELAVLADARANMEQNAGMFSALGDALLYQVQIEYGFWVIAAGAALMLIGGLIALSKRPLKAVQAETSVKTAS